MLRLIASSHVLAALLVNALTAQASPSQSQWKTLNDTVGGRLRQAVPLSEPCFSIVSGTPTVPNVSECTTVEQNYTDGFFREQHFGSYMNSQWETCQSSAVADGCLLDANNVTDPAAFKGTDCEIGNIPPYYINVTSSTDVQAALAFSNATGVKLSVKNKGHDYKGRSSGKDTLSLWVTSLNSISYNSSFSPEGCSSTYDAMTIGSGVTTDSVYQFANRINRTFIGGYAQTVGVGGGWILGGGHSVLSPVYGLGVDRVVQFKVVTPDGVYRTANECQNTDLFFALRGGGGNAFGVLIESTSRVEPQLTLQVASIDFTPTNLSVYSDWYRLLINSSFAWAEEGWGGHIVGPSIIHVNPLLNSTAAKASMQNVSNFAAQQNGSIVIEELPSWYSFYQKYVTAAEAPVGLELMLGTRLLSTSLFSTEKGQQDLGDAVSTLLTFGDPYVVVGTPFKYNYTEGSTSITPAWRDSIWHFGINSDFDFDSTLDERRDTYQNVSSYTQILRDLTPEGGSYFNEGDVYEPNHTYSYWGPNYSRLLSIKQKYDPDGLLDCWQCVGWKGADDQLYQCYIKGVNASAPIS